MSIPGDSILASIPAHMWERMDRMGEALDAIITRKRTGPKWDKRPYLSRPRDGWSCFLSDGAHSYRCTIEPKLWGVYEVRVARERTFPMTVESATVEDVRAAIRTAERLMSKVAGWKFWDEKRRAALDIPSYR